MCQMTKLLVKMDKLQRMTQPLGKPQGPLSFPSRSGADDVAAGADADDVPASADFVSVMGLEGLAWFSPGVASGSDPLSSPFAPPFSHAKLTLLTAP